MPTTTPGALLLQLYFKPTDKKPDETLTKEQLKSILVNGTNAPEYVACCQQLIEFFDKVMDIVGDFAEPKIKRLIMNELDNINTDMIDAIKERLK